MAASHTAQLFFKAFLMFSCLSDSGHRYCFSENIFDDLIIWSDVVYYPKKQGCRERIWNMSSHDRVKVPRGRVQPRSTGFCGMIKSSGSVLGLHQHYQISRKNFCNHSHADLIPTIRYFKRIKKCKLENCTLPHLFFLTDWTTFPCQKQRWETIKKIPKKWKLKKEKFKGQPNSKYIP